MHLGGGLRFFLAALSAAAAISVAALRFILPLRLFPDLGDDQRRHSPGVGLFGLFLGLLRDIVQHVRRLLAVLGPSAGNGAQLVGLIQVQAVVGVRVQPDLDRLAQQIDLHRGAVAVNGLHKGALLGHLLHQILIGRLFITQAAHQPSAGTGDLRRVERERLHLGHFGGNGLEILQKLAAAIGPPADADAAEHLRLVPHADLSQLDAVAEHARQILDQLTEVHASV